MSWWPGSSFASLPSFWNTNKLGTFLVFPVNNAKGDGESSYSAIAWLSFAFLQLTFHYFPFVLQLYSYDIWYVICCLYVFEVITDVMTILIIVVI